jgi:hypothetical protein
MLISSIKSTDLVVLGVQHGFIDSKNIICLPSTHLYGIKIFTNIFGVFWIFLEFVEAVDAHLVRSS